MAPQKAGIFSHIRPICISYMHNLHVTKFCTADNLTQNRENSEVWYVPLVYFILGRRLFSCPEGVTGNIMQ